MGHPPRPWSTAPTQENPEKVLNNGTFMNFSESKVLPEIMSLPTVLGVTMCSSFLQTVHSQYSFKIMSLLTKIKGCQCHLGCSVNFLMECDPKVSPMEMVFQNELLIVDRERAGKARELL